MFFHYIAIVCDHLPLSVWASYMKVPVAETYLKFIRPMQQMTLVARQAITTLIGCAAIVSPNLQIKSAVK